MLYPSGGYLRTEIFVSESMSHALRVVIQLDANLYGDNISQATHKS